MDIKRTVLWVIFSMSLLLLWDNWMKHNGKQSMFFPTQNQQAKNASASAVAAAAPAAGNASNAVTDAVAAAIVQAVKSETITITTDLIKADIDTIGGEIKRLELLNYPDSHEPKKNVVLFDHHAGRTRIEETSFFGFFKGTKEVPVPPRTYAAQTGLLGGNFPNHKSGFVALPGPRTLDGANELSLVLESEQAGVKLTKTLVFKKGSYVIDVKHTVVNTTAAPISPSLYLQLIHDGTKPTSGGMFSGQTEFYAPAVYTEAKHFQKLNFEDIEKRHGKSDAKPDHETKADNGWISMIEHFFVSAFIPEDKVQREIRTERVRDNIYSISSVIPLGNVAAGASVTSNARLYSGPQESAILEKVAPGMDLVKDYWYFAMIAKPMFWIMELIHKVLGNWGWTIVVFTIAIKLALFPLSAAGYRSMAKMKVVTPKMTALKEKYKNEPQKLNMAMMELYKTEKINPLGGCLPILIQMPIFLSLYWVLQASVEMRGAPWMAWITDLSKPDPYLVLPILYAISMYITTKLSPAPADPVQAKMMLFMPLLFSIMFFFFPSGLVLYWVVNNVLSIGQQWVINNKIVPPEHR
ncbi:membrane protein insertase YidC [Undibacterium fentianense]|uniref:Membrane protein insertase YidC n=1 Tax=Undibacterium fentianense TaxID=2828728 RepID=A0A941IDL6_9BURK|nr:membrane protein insertase YidC [Undibacterium fentianense]MBR7801454.1 membrane protein insertase YidC [Undibacterium fentianense]